MRRRPYSDKTQMPLGRKIFKQVIMCAGIGLTCLIIKSIQLPSVQTASNAISYALTYTVDYELTLEHIRSAYLKMMGKDSNKQLNDETITNDYSFVQASDDNINDGTTLSEDDGAQNEAVSQNDERYDHKNVDI